MVSPGKLRLLTELADGTVDEYGPSIADDGSVSYPDAESILDPGDADAGPTLERLAKRGILEETFQEKVYICPECGDEGMQYTTACRACGSPHNVETELFEHIDCGATEPRAEFVVGSDEYVCPGCEASLSSLNHINRWTRYRCQECGEQSETPEHGLRCRACLNICQPLDAIERVLCRYRLADGGREWLDVQLAARESVAAALEDRGLSVTVDATLQGGSGTTYPVHVLGEDELLGDRTVASVHERPSPEAAETLRAAAEDADARAILVTTLGSVGERTAALAEEGDIKILAADAEGTLTTDYEITDEPETGRNIIQRLTSAVTQPRSAPR